MFEDLDDYQSFARRPGTFVPHKVDEITRPFEQAKKAKELFYQLKRETDRKRLAADVEIKVSLLVYCYQILSNLYGLFLTVARHVFRSH